MKTLFAAYALLACLSSHADTNLFPILTAGGETYNNARLISHTDTNALFFHDNGAVRIAFTNLPVSIQKQYGYDPQKVQALAEAERDKEWRRKSNAIAEKVAADEKWLNEHPSYTEIKISPRIRYEFNESDGTATYECKMPIVISDDAALYTTALQTDESNDGPIFKIYFESKSREAKYGHNADLSIFYDGHRKKFRDVEVLRTVEENGDVSEGITIDLPLKEFKTIARCHNVDIQIGAGPLMPVGSDARNDWRLMADKLTPAK